MSSSPNAAQLLLSQCHRLPMLLSFSCPNVIVYQCCPASPVPMLSSSNAAQPASPVLMSSSPNAAQLLLFQCHRLPMLPSFSCPNVIVFQCCPASPVPTSSSSNAAQLLLFQCHRLPMLPSFSCSNVIVSPMLPSFSCPNFKLLN